MGNTHCCLITTSCTPLQSVNVQCCTNKTEAHQYWPLPAVWCCHKKDNMWLWSLQEDFYGYLAGMLQYVGVFLVKFDCYIITGFSCDNWLGYYYRLYEIWNHTSFDIIDIFECGNFNFFSFLSWVEASSSLLFPFFHGYTIFFICHILRSFLPQSSFVYLPHIAQGTRKSSFYPVSISIFIQLLFKHLYILDHNQLFFQIIPRANSLTRKAVFLDVAQTSTLLYFLPAFPCVRVCMCVCTFKLCHLIKFITKLTHIDA